MCVGFLFQIFHSFHEEVKLYQQHWWRCDGPCQRRPPYFGMVKRAMNRAPGPTDFWWEEHQATCGGRYVKVREPLGFSEKKTKQINKKGNFSQKFITSSNTNLTIHATVFIIQVTLHILTFRGVILRCFKLHIIECRNM
jgi:hypothetical protein